VKFLALIILIFAVPAFGQSNSSEWLWRGCGLYDQGKYNESIQAFDNAIEISPKFDLLWFFEGRSLFMLGKYDEAIKCFDAGIQVDPKNGGMGLYWKGKTLQTQGKYDDAIKSYDAAIKLGDFAGSSLINKGIALNAQGKYDEAIKAVDEAFKIYPNDGDMWIGKGDVLYGQGKYDEAIKAYEEALSSSDVRHNESWYNKGVSHLMLREYKNASIAFDVAIKLGVTKAWGGKSLALNGLGDYEGALVAADKAISLNVNNPDIDIWVVKANALKMLHRGSEADAAYDKVLEPQIKEAVPLVSEHQVSASNVTGSTESSTATKLYKISIDHTPGFAEAYVLDQYNNKNAVNVTEASDYLNTCIDESQACIFSAGDVVNVLDHDNEYSATRVFSRGGILGSYGWYWVNDGTIEDYP
jgi:tetratricopeptide (TPR) repeat protein